MSEVRVNKLSPRSGTTVTLGDSGDTITIPSGVTFDASSGGLAGTLTTAAQPNITQTGTLTSFTSTGIDDNATSTAITIGSGNNVGIGTSTLTYNGLALKGRLELRTNSDDNSGGWIETTDESGASNGLEIHANRGAGKIVFSTTGAGERMRIDSSGNVGIGISSPAAQLDIREDGTGTLTKRVQANIDLSSVTNLLSTDPTLFIQQAGTGSAGVVLKSGTVDFALRLDSSGNFIFDKDTTERMRIDSSGNVGIGTTTPQEKLHIETPTGSASETGLKIRNGTGVNDAMAQIKLQGAYAATSNEATAIISGGRESSGNASKITFSTGTTSQSERMRITSGGNVGIGISAPTATLHVEDEVADNSEEASFILARSKKYSGYVSNVTASTGTIIFQISSINSNYRSALCKLNLHSRTPSAGGLANHPSAVYYFTLVLAFGATANFSTPTLTAVYENVFDKATDFAFSSTTNNRTCTLTFTNPTSLIQTTMYYTLEIIGERYVLDSVTKT